MIDLEKLSPAPWAAWTHEGSFAKSFHNSQMRFAEVHLQLGISGSAGLEYRRGADG